jgi:uncharacterized protein with FMN-binding domain
MWMMDSMNAGSSPHVPRSGAVDRPIDPLLAGRPKPQRVDPPSRRRHPARSARAVALLASAASTAGLAAWIAYGEGAFEASGNSESATAPNLPGISPHLIPSSTHAVDSAAADLATDDLVTDDELAAVPDDGDPGAAEPLRDEVTSDDVLARSGTSTLADGVFIGTAEDTEWGDVQVEVTVVDGRIVDIEAIEIPGGRRSSQINGRAEPILEADAVALQTSDLDIVSGATYTSITYADSLQAALDAAALAAEPPGVAGA